MKNTHKYILFALVGLIVAGVLWWALGSFLGALLGLGGTGGALKRYVDADLTRIQNEERARREQMALYVKQVAQKRKDDEWMKQRKEADEAANKKRVDDALTVDQLNQELDKGIDEATRYYDAEGHKPEGREGGFSVVKVLLFLLGAMLFLTVLAASCDAGAGAPNSPVSAAQRARTLKLLNLIKRGVREHQALKKKHSREIATLQGKIRILEDQRASDRQVCAEKIAALNMKPPCPVGPIVAVSSVATAALCAAGFGVYMAVRPR